MVGHSRRVQLSLILSIMGFCLLVTAPSWATLQCGDIIEPGQVATLTHDLSCPGGNANSAALTVEGGSILNLNGHTVDCVDQRQIGIHLNGGGSIVQYGTVMNCFTGVRVAGEGGHIVTTVTARSNNEGFLIISEDNELRYTQSTNNIVNGYLLFTQASTRNTFKENLAKDNGVAGFFVNPGISENTFTKNQAIGNGFLGFLIQGNQNQVTGNLAKNNGNVSNNPGFHIIGSNSQVLYNTSIGNTADGFLFNPGAGNTALGNTAKQNGRNGIRLESGAINSTLLRNVAKRNTGDDLFDGNTNCDNNQWVGNRFQSSNQGCIH